MSKMGKTSKKVVFYESDKRYADLKIALESDGLPQASFFRCMVQGYINQDKNIMAYISKIKSKEVKMPKTWDRESAVKRRLAAQKMRDLRLTDEEIGNIFDILEKESGH